MTDLFSERGGFSEMVGDLRGTVTQDGVAYFAAADAQAGVELWRSDGTAAGTYRMSDVCPGSCSSNPVPLAVIGGRLYFTADDGERGAEVWRTGDGVGREELVEDGCPGACSDTVVSAVVWRGALWLLRQRAEKSAPYFWRTDGTAGGTGIVAHFCADLGLCGFRRFAYATILRPAPGGAALLLDFYGPLGEELVRTDATRAGTETVHAPFESTLFGSVDEPLSPAFFVEGGDLWTTDGTAAGTRRVRNLGGLVELDYDGKAYAYAGEVIGGALYAVFNRGEWVRSDGTANGTVLLANVGQGPWTIYDIAAVVALHGEAYAIANGLWRSGGTPASTARVADTPGDVEAVVKSGERLFLLRNTYLHRQPLWVTDGTEAGTARVDLGPGAVPNDGGIAALGDGVLIARGGEQLWRATAAGASLLHDLEPANGPSGPHGQTVFGDRLFFFARSGSRVGLFASDGTPEGTAPLGAGATESFRPTSFDFFGAAFGPRDHLFSAAGGHLFFSTGEDARYWIFESWPKFWVTSGDADSTRVLRRGIVGFPVADLGGKLVFDGVTPPFTCGNAGYFPGEGEPWLSEGSPQTTREIVDLNPATYWLSSQCSDLPESSAPGPGVVIDGAALMAATERRHGRELFATDGTASGTRLVADLNPRSGPDPNGGTRALDSDPRELVALGGRVLFSADDGVTGRELWSTDGRPRGTRRVVDLLPGPAGSNPHDLVVFQSAVFFVAARGAGEALFRTDGTAAGTRLVSDLLVSGAPSRARQLTVAGGRLFFTAWNAATGTELWSSLGTAATTALVADLRPGDRGSMPQQLKNIRGVLVFAADDGVSGLEPWRSDGTAEGTVPLGDLAPGPASSNPGPFDRLGDRVLFGADDGLHGRELWSLPLAAVLDPNAD